MFPAEKRVHSVHRKQCSQQRNAFTAFTENSVPSRETRSQRSQKTVFPAEKRVHSVHRKQCSQQRLKKRVHRKQNKCFNMSSDSFSVQYSCSPLQAIKTSPLERCSDVWSLLCDEHRGYSDPIRSNSPAKYHNFSSDHRRWGRLHLSARAFRPITIIILIESSYYCFDNLLLLLLLLLFNKAKYFVISCN